MQRAFALRPLPVARETLGALRELQPVTNRLYDRIACDTDWLLETFRPLAQCCAWSAMEMAAHARTAAAARKKPRLMLPNSVFLQGAERSGLALTCGNVQAGEPYQLELVHRLHAAEHERVAAGPLTTVCEALARAARMVHASRPTVAVLTKPGPSLALRTRADVRGVGEELRRKHGMRVVYVSMADLARAKLDGTGDLRLDGQAISVIYSRYDFSHPWGRCVDDVPTGDLRDEWTTIERIEASSAVVSSSLGSRLAHRRTTQLALLRTGVIERFLPPADAAAVRAVLPEQWRLGVELGGGGPNAEAEAADARARVESDAHGYVAKNVLRPRTGSNSTQARATHARWRPRDTALGSSQDRHASGGAIVADASALREIARDRTRSGRFVLSRKISPLTHAAELAPPPAGAVVHVDAAVSELASFGAFLAGAEAFAEGDALVNACAGVGARTRPAASDHPRAKEIGYGALSCCQEAAENVAA